MEIEIETGVPLPSTTYHHKYPWADLKIDQSFFIPEDQAKNESMRSAAEKAGKRLGKRFTTRAVVHKGIKGTRVWRVE